MDDLPNRNDLDALRAEIDALERAGQALQHIPEIKAAAASADEVMDELCGPAPATLETKAHGRGDLEGIRARDLRALGQEAIRTADDTSSNGILGGTGIKNMVGDLISGLGLRRAAPEDKALRRGPAATRRPVSTRPTSLAARDPVAAATVAIGRELLALKAKAGRLERAVSTAEVKRDRPPGLASRFPGIIRRNGGASPYQALHKAAVLSWMRSGREDYQGHHIADLQRKALGLHGESNPDGGYFVLADRVNNPLDARLIELSPIRQHATVRSIVGDRLQQPVNKKGTKAYWRSEREPRPDTETPELGLNETPAMELEACPQVTQRLLDDVTGFDPEAWLAQEVVQAFAEAESVSFVTGTGLDEPKGLLTYPMELVHANWAHGKFRAVKTGVSGDFPAADDDAAALLIDVQYSIKAAYLPTAKWWMNRATAAKIRKLRDLQGRFLWQEGLQVGQPPMLLGHEIVLDEYVPTIGADSISLGFLDFARTYIIVDRVGVRVLRDPYTNRPWVKFATTKRVGGAVQMFDAASFLVFSA